MGKNHSGRSQERRPSSFGEEPLDFDPRQQVKLALSGRKSVEGFTFDPAKTYIRDDALVGIQQLDDGWCVTSAIVDVPAVVPEDSQLRKVAAERMDEVYLRGRGTRRIFPVDFLEKYVGFKEGVTRPAITFSMLLDKNFSLKKYEISKAGFRVLEAFDDEKIKATSRFSQHDVQNAKHASRSLYRNRMESFVGEYDSQLPGDVPELFRSKIKDCKGMREGELLVHEVTRLTNRVAADFFHAHNLAVPFYEQRSIIRPSFVTQDYEFDRLCNEMCIKMIKDIEGQRLASVHLTSPMRHYKDFLAMQVMGDFLAGKPENQDLKAEIQGLTATFNKHSCLREVQLLNKSWKKEWDGIRQEQNNWHPFMDLDVKKSYRSPAVQLKTICDEKQISYPQTALRQLQVRGREFYFVGMSLYQPTAQPHQRQSWGVASTPDAALEYAAHRMLKGLDCKSVPAVAVPA